MDDEKVALVDMDGTLCDFRGALDRDVARVLNGRGEEVKVPPCVIQEIGFRIMILTKSSKQSKNAWSEKAAWIAEHLPPDVEMTVTQDKGLYYGRVLVDDYPNHFLRWMDHRPRGIVVMPTQAWNKDTSRRLNLYPVSSREELEKIRPVLEEAFDRKGGERGSR